MIHLPQDKETPLTTLVTPFGTVLYLYSRSIDSITGGTTGQDYVAFHYDDKNLAFAVCDGVGQSFMGDVAARALGDGLVSWLWEIRQPEDAAGFSAAAHEALNDLTRETKKLVADYALPESLPPILKQALEMQRAYGSESMFVAGRICLGGPGTWVALCWLGDAPVAAVDVDGKLVDLSPHGQTSERWNATTGVKGVIHAWVSHGETIARVAGYTDGLGIEGVPVDEDLKRIMEHWVLAPPMDDASLFDVRLAPSPQTTGQEFIPLLPESIPIRRKGKSRIAPPADDETMPQVIILPPDANPAVNEWRPLIIEKPAKPEKKPDIPELKPSDVIAQLPMSAEISEEDLKVLEELGKRADLNVGQQVRMWQKAAMLGLTSAALAMLMIERLIDESDDDSGAGR